MTFYHSKLALICSLFVCGDSFRDGGSIFLLLASQGIQSPKWRGLVAEVRRSQPKRLDICKSRHLPGSGLGQLVPKVSSQEALTFHKWALIIFLLSIKSVYVLSIRFSY